MAAPPLKITGFLGQAPRTAARLLPDMASVTAENINLTSGEIRPVRGPLLAYSPADNDVSHKTAYRAVNGASEKWRTWTGDIDVAKGPFASDVEARYYWTGDGCPRYAKFTDFGSTEYALGIPTPTGKPTISATGGVGSTISRSYCYTFYQPSTGEESSASPAGDVASGKVDGTWTISGFSGTPANDRTIPYNTAGLYQRLYRTAGTTASWQLVAERAVSTGNWTDTLTDSQILGDELVSFGWVPPPVGLTGIMSLPNGSLVGFVGSLICYSKPYQPHAWPVAYQLGCDFPVVGLSAFGSTVVAATQAKPYVFDGVDPASVTPQRIDTVWPCLSKRSVVSVGDGVLYATSYGLAFIGASGPDIWTKAFYTSEEWQPLNPASMVGATAEGKVYMLYTPTGSSPRMMVFNVGEAATLTEIAVACTELYADPTDGRLYLVDQTVTRWNDSPGEKLLFNWLSKEIELPEPCNYGAAKVDWVTTTTEADAAAIQAAYQAALVINQASLSIAYNAGAINVDPVNALAVNGSRIKPLPVGDDVLTFTLYAKGTEVYSEKVLSNEAFRLPAGYKSDFVSIRLSGNVRVKSVKIAETVQGLKQV